MNVPKPKILIKKSRYRDAVVLHCTKNLTYIATYTAHDLASYSSTIVFALVSLNIIHSRCGRLVLNLENFETCYL
jgi:hypothetical protein